MAERLSLGPVQIGEATVEEINAALRTLQERIDALYGLTGPVTVHDTVTPEAVRVEDEDDTLIHGLGVAE
jgi:hypothetical protein